MNKMSGVRYKHYIVIIHIQRSMCNVSFTINNNTFDKLYISLMNHLNQSSSIGNYYYHCYCYHSQEPRLCCIVFIWYTSSLFTPFFILFGFETLYKYIHSIEYGSWVGWSVYYSETNPFLVFKTISEEISSFIDTETFCNRKKTLDS